MIAYQFDSTHIFWASGLSWALCHTLEKQEQFRQFRQRPCPGNSDSGGRETGLQPWHKLWRQALQCGGEIGWLYQGVLHRGDSISAEIWRMIQSQPYKGSPIATSKNGKLTSHNKVNWFKDNYSLMLIFLLKFTSKNRTKPLIFPQWIEIIISFSAW